MAAHNQEQGTGKHPHKSAEDPRPHTKESGNAGHESGSKSQKTSAGNERQNSSGNDDLKEREYTDSKGEVHHHTHTYSEQHKGK